MKKKRGFLPNGIKFWILTGIVICMLLSLFLFDFSSRVDHQLDGMAGGHLKDIGKQSAQQMKSIMDGAVKEVQDAAFYLSELQNKTETDMSILLSQIQERDEFSAVRIVDKNGTVYRSNGERMEVNELSSEEGKLYVDKLLEGKSGISDVFESALSNEKIFVVYAPVIEDGNVSGGIFGTVVLGNLVDSVASSGFSGYCYSYIVSGAGELIMQSDHMDSLYIGPNFFEFLDHQTDSRTMDSAAIQTYMKNQESGYFRYRAGDEERLAYFIPSKINDWYVITAVTAESVKEYKDGINITAFFLTFKIAMVFFALALIIVWWSGKARGLILKSKADLELEKKKLELSLKHTSNRIFEYRKDLDEFTFLAGRELGEQRLPDTITAFSEKEESQGIVAVEYFKQLCRLIDQAGSGEVCPSVEMKGGRWFPEDYWFRLSLSVIENAQGHILDVIGTMEDISQKKKDRRRYEQEEQYRRALLSETVAIWSVDLMKQTVLSCSVAGGEICAEEGEIPYGGQFLEQIGITAYSRDLENITQFLQSNHLLAAYYVGNRELKGTFRMKYPSIEEYHWLSCNISLLSEPFTGNPIAFAYLRDVDEERKREMALTYSSERDPLTGLYNRRNISERIESILNQEEHLSCLMMMDLDGFKGINDRYGHQEGDRALKAIANVLTGAFRSEDLVARMGGDEFVAFLDHLPNKNCAYERAEFIRTQVEALMVSEKLPQMSVSIGLAYAPEDGQNFALLYKHADEALYEAKREGRNMIIMYSGNR